ncbi:MAG: hypothetical protein KDG52_06875, partial [Rhodocyclaceae bacterium]|nr:hypothetical protein [Rhodocyclaceae bacterium]
CEYMTGGVVVILGEIGRNFAAGMSGGEAFVLDSGQRLRQCLNGDLVTLESLHDARDAHLLQCLLRNHRAATGSARAERLLAAWPDSARQFAKIMPIAYADVLRRQRARGLDLRAPAPAPLGPGS